jgi:molybdopterin converting factor subunit 1
MDVTIHLFATLRDRAGQEHIQLELPDAASVSQMTDALVTAYPSLRDALGSTLIAVNREYAFPQDTLSDGDEVALFPPVSGGSNPQWPEVFAITDESIDVNEVIASIVRPETGAVCTFTGAVRGITHSDGGSFDTASLHYAAYEAMALDKLHQVAAEIRERYPSVQGLAIVQRLGDLEVGEMTVLVACASGHRNDGVFDAARYGIDRLKEIVPVWKKEIGPDNSHWVEGKYHPTPDDIAPDS